MFSIDRKQIDQRAAHMDSLDAAELEAAIQKCGSKARYDATKYLEKVKAIIEFALVRLARAPADDELILVFRYSRGDDTSLPPDVVEILAETLKESNYYVDTLLFSGYGSVWVRKTPLPQETEIGHMQVTFSPKLENLHQFTWRGTSKRCD